MRVSYNINSERIRMLPFISFLSGLAFLSWTFLYYFLFKAATAGQICFVSGLLSVVIGLWIYKKPTPFGSHLLAINIWLNLVISGYFGGGFSSSAMFHLIIFPIGSFVIFNRKEAVFWSFVALLGILYFCALAYFNIPLPMNFSISQWTLMYQITFYSIFLIAFFVIFQLKLNEEKHNEAYSEVLRTNIDLEKRNQLGQMAGQIAHEINNPLAIIKGHISNLKRKLTIGQNETNDFERYITPVERNIDRIEKVVRSLKYMSRDASLDPLSKVSVEEIIEEALIICSEKFRLENIVLELQDKDDLRSFQVETKRVLVSQVLLALLDNSFDEVVAIDNKVITLQIIKDSTHLKIQVIDSGRGILQSRTELIFEPFFSTKTKDIHIGLGLAQAKDLMTNINGDLKFIGNNPTTFEIAIKL